MVADPNQPDDPQTAALFAQWARVFTAHLQAHGLLNTAPAVYNPSNPYGFPDMTPEQARHFQLEDRALQELRNDARTNDEAEYDEVNKLAEHGQTLPQRSGGSHVPMQQPGPMKSFQAIAAVDGPLAGIDNQNTLIRNPNGGRLAE